MNGRLIGLILIVSGLVAGAAVYYLQVFAFYDRLDPAKVDLKITRGGFAGSIEARGVKAIDAKSSPIRFRACFEAPATVTAGAKPYPEPVPLTAPFWFDCFDAVQIAADVRAGAARAFLGEENIVYGIDRVLAIYNDGRGFAWHQINHCGEEVFDGRPPPKGCPAPE